MMRLLVVVATLCVALAAADCGCMKEIDNLKEENSALKAYAAAMENRLRNIEITLHNRELGGMRAAIIYFFQICLHSILYICA